MFTPSIRSATRGLLLLCRYIVLVYKWAELHILSQLLSIFREILAANLLCVCVCMSVCVYGQRVVCWSFLLSRLQKKTLLIQMVQETLLSEVSDWFSLIPSFFLYYYIYYDKMYSICMRLIVLFKDAFRSTGSVLFKFQFLMLFLFQFCLFNFSFQSWSSFEEMFVSLHFFLNGFVLFCFIFTSKSIKLTT